MGEVRAKVLSDIKDSKHRDGLPYVRLSIEGQEYFFNLENAEIEREFEGLNGKTIFIEGTGHKDNAEVFINVDDTVEDRGARRERPARDDRRESRRERPARDEREPETEPDDRTEETRRESAPKQAPAKPVYDAKAAMNHARSFLMQCANGQRLALNAAEFVAFDYHERTGKTMEAAQFQGVSMSMYLGMERANIIRTLPTTDYPLAKLDFAAARAAQKEAAQNPAKQETQAPASAPANPAPAKQAEAPLGKVVQTAEGLKVSIPTDEVPF